MSSDMHNSEDEQPQQLDSDIFLKPSSYQLPCDTVTVNGVPSVDDYWQTMMVYNVVEDQFHEWTNTIIDMKYTPLKWSQGKRQIIQWLIACNTGSLVLISVPWSIFTGQITQPTVSSTEGQQLVSTPGKGPIPPGQALYKVKWSKYNFNKQKHLHSTIKSEDTDVLGGLRARPNEIKARSSRPTWKNCSLWLCNAEMLHNPDDM